MTYCRTAQFGENYVRISFVNHEEAYKYTQEEINEMGKKFMHDVKKKKGLKPKEIPF